MLPGMHSTYLWYTLCLTAYAKLSPLSLKSPLFPQSLHSSLASNLSKKQRLWVGKPLTFLPRNGMILTRSCLTEVLSFSGPRAISADSLNPPSCPVSFENFPPLMISSLLYFLLLPIHDLLHNLWGTIFLGDHVFAAQPPASSGPFLSAYKRTCFPLILIRTFSDPIFSLSVSLEPLLSFTAKFPERGFRICWLHLFLHFSPLPSGRHPSPPLYSNDSVNSGHYILTAKSNGLFQHSSPPTSLTALRQ